MKITKKALTSFVRSKLATDAVWTVKALVKLYTVGQTAQEQSSHTTIEANGVGFSGNDAEFLSSLALAAIRYGDLTPKQLAFAQKIMPRYSRQVIGFSDAAKLEAAFVKSNPAQA